MTSTSPGKQKAYGIAPTAENLAHCVEHINQLIPEPNIVLVTGDVTDKGQLEEAEHAALLLNKLHAPYYLVPGNHDDRSTLSSVFGKNACPRDNNGFISYVLNDYDIRLIGVDSTIPGSAGGELCDKRIKGLQELLSTECEKPVILFMHHPPAKFGVLETDKDGFIGATKFAELVAQHTNIIGILCGHIHLTAHSGWSGTVISTAPSMGLQLVLDLTLTHHSAFNLDAPGYLLHYLNPDNTLVSHTITVKDMDGPYRFKEHRGSA